MRRGNSSFSYVKQQCLPKKRRRLADVREAGGSSGRQLKEIKANDEPNEPVLAKSRNENETVMKPETEMREIKENPFEQLLKSFGNNTKEWPEEDESDEDAEEAEDTQTKTDKLVNEVITINEDEDTDKELAEEEEEEEIEKEDKAETERGDKELDLFTVHFDAELDSKYFRDLEAAKRVEISETSWPVLGNVVTKGKNVCELPENLLKHQLVVQKNVEKFGVKKVLMNNVWETKASMNAEKESLEFSDFQLELLSIANRYKDFLYTERTDANREEIRLIYCLHAMNHMLKTRQKILRHNSKISKFDMVRDEYRDQGLTRPKVVILVPFRESCLQVVRCMIGLIFGQARDSSDSKINVMNMKRFNEEFLPEEENRFINKPDDYTTTFAGNSDDAFRLGLSVTKKSLKLYSDFYSSDIIVASPLGLRMIIGAEGEKEREYDFLSSIELLIMDQTDVFLMQNWEHVVHVMKHINLQPKESHGVDFSRVKMWALEGWSKYYRQTLVFSSICSPEITALFNKEANNFEGQVTLRNTIPTEKCSMRQVFVECPQIFQRFDCSSFEESPDARFKFFISKVLPQIKEQLSHVLIFVASYFDYVRLRNYFRKEELEFTQVCEYTKPGKVAKARALFFHEGRKFMLYTERFHFYHRYAIKGVRHLVFYQLPTYPRFYSELCNLLHPRMQGKKFVGDEASFTCTSLFNRLDVYQLAAIIGSEKVSRLLQSDLSAHTFLTENKL